MHDGEDNAAVEKARGLGRGTEAEQKGGEPTGGNEPQGKTADGGQEQENCAATAGGRFVAFVLVRL